jgi:hypothetical protein
MKRTTRLLAFASIAHLALCLSLVAQTMPRNSGLSASAPPIQGASSSPTVSPANPNSRPLPFHGMVSEVDQKNKTFTISGKEARRIFKVTSKTQIIKGSGIATKKDIVDNEEVSGSYWKNADGTLEAKVVKLGPTEKKTASPAAKASPSVSPGPSTSPKL